MVKWDEEGFEGSGEAPVEVKNSSIHVNSNHEAIP